MFGPVLTLQTFDDEDEAIALANETDYGLAAILYTGDRERAERVSERLVAGTVWVNCFFVRDLRAPFGGREVLGRRPRGRRLELRLLRGREERLHGTLERRELTTMGEIVGAALVAHVPTIMLPEEVRLRDQRGQGDHARPRACTGCKSEVLDRLQPDTVIVFDTHWESTFEHIVTRARAPAGQVHEPRAPARHEADPVRHAGRPRARER